MTRSGFAGYGLIPVGSFLGKPETAPPSAPITRAGFSGYGLKRAGSFAGKPLAEGKAEDYYLPHANNFFDTNVRGYT